MVHHTRQGFVEQRTATLNRIRGLLSVGAGAAPQTATVRREALARLEELPGWPQHCHRRSLGEVTRR